MQREHVCGLFLAFVSLTPLSLTSLPLRWQWTPLPLLNGTAVIEQPVDLSTIGDRYALQAQEWFQRHAGEGANPWLLQVQFSHVHVPLFCNTSDDCGFSNTVTLMDVNVSLLSLPCLSSPG